MKILVLVKEVPDTYGDRHLAAETGLVDRDASDAVLDESSERALEVAVSYRDEHPEGTEVVLLTLGPERAEESLRRGLTLGADSAVHVEGEGLRGADLTLTAEVLAAAARRIGFDLVIAGDASSDGRGGVIPAMVAELLDIPAATALSSVVLEEGRVGGVRATEDRALRITAPLPALISVTEALPEARLANFRAIMAAKKKPYERLDVAELGIDPEDYSVPRSIMIRVAEAPPRTAGTKTTDDGEAGNVLADFLLTNRLV